MKNGLRSGCRLSSGCLHWVQGAGVGWLKGEGDRSGGNKVSWIVVLIVDDAEGEGSMDVLLPLTGAVSRHRFKDNTVGKGGGHGNGHLEAKYRVGYFG